MTLSFNGLPLKVGERIIFTYEDRLYYGTIDFICGCVVKIKVNILDLEYIIIDPKQVVKLPFNLLENG